MAAIAFDLVNGTNQKVNSFTVTTSGGNDPVTWSPGDWFGVAAYGSWPQSAGVPFALADDSVNNISGGGVFASDTQGIIDSTTAPTDSFFGSVDTVNGSNAGGTATAAWEFDISNAENLELFIDMAAMGDFESSNDSYVWSYSIDGGAFQDVFVSSVDEAGSQTYTMENGVAVTLDDPLLINGVTLNDEFQTLSSTIAGIGSTLTLQVAGGGDGGSEAYAAQNILVEGDIVPSVIAFDLVNGASQNLNSFNVATSGGADPVSWAPGDWFGVAAYGSWPQSAGVPFALADDSVAPISGSVFASDTQGIIDSATAPTDTFFGSVDTVNNSNPGGTATGTWEFNIGGAENLELAIDMAAMGDFESSNDSYVWSYSIDGGAFQDVFVSSVDEAGSQTYTMENGVAVTLDDPLLINGVTLNDEFQTLTEAIVGTGSTLTLQVAGGGDGGSEAYAAQNIQILGGGGSTPTAFYDESVDGDLSTDPNAPTALSFNLGSNTVIGSVATPADTRDFITFTIPEGQELTGILLQDYDDLDTAPASDGNRGFNAINAGTTGFIPGGDTIGNFLGGAHLDPLTPGSDLLPILAEAPQAGTGFTTPLGAGDYVYVIQQTGPQNTGYTLDFILENAPVIVPEVAIFDIQGAGHDSPFVGQAVTTTGIVTAVAAGGFYLQDANGDGDIATSDAIFVAGATATVGDSVEVTGTVTEADPQGGGADLDITTLVASSTTILSSGNALPAAVIIGATGRQVPTENINDDAFTSFDPTTDGADFFESLESMRVTATDLVAVAGTNRFEEIFAVTDQGANATGISDRGTLNISPDDFNPEKIQIDADPTVSGFSIPFVDTGAILGDVTGVISYDFGNFQIVPTEDFTANVQDANLQPEVTAIAGTADKLTVASYNVLNLETNDGDGDTDVANGRFDAIAAQVVTNLNTPDIIGLQEIQDNSGSVNDGVTAADVTLQTLVDAIAAAGGPTYEFIDNTFIGNNVSGGQPGGNIRTAFLYNPDRVAVDAGSVRPVGSQAPGEAFNGARLPLAADFTFNGETVTIVNNHFSSKGGSAPIVGLEQPFEARQEEVAVNGSLDERQAQSAAVQGFVTDILTADANANVVVLGDLNEFEFVSPVLELETNAGLNNLTNTLPEDERYTFIFQGNSQSLDHILVSDSLVAGTEFDIVHVNPEFAETPQRASDHEPLVASLDFGDPAPATFTLELLHAADQEAGALAVQDAPRFSAVLNALRAEDLGGDGLEDNTLTLSSGDAFIPGLFYDASGPVFGSGGIADIQIQNELGFQAIALGNHEFDFGTAELAGLIDGSAPGDILGADFAGADFPYLATNLDFATDANLASLEVAGGAAPQANTVTSSVVIDVNGENVGVVGAITPTLGSISNPGDVGVSPAPFEANPTPEQLDALAAEIQTEVDALLAADPTLNKVVLLAHQQQFSIELALAERLTNVDIIVAGGSNTRLFDDNDRPRDGDSDQGQYPQFVTNAGGTQTAVVNTDGSYKYVGRLVLDFDTDGNIIPESYDETVSGAYATDDQGVADLNAAGLVDPEMQEIADAIEALRSSPRKATSLASRRMSS